MTPASQEKTSPDKAHVAARDRRPGREPGASASLADKARGMSFAEGEALLAPKGPRYTVRPGDTLGEIAKRVLGDASRWREIYALNQALIGPNPDRVQVGQELSLPAGARVEGAQAPALASGKGAADVAEGQDESGPAGTVEDQARGLARRVAAGVKGGADSGKDEAKDKAGHGELGAHGAGRYESREPAGPRDKTLFSHADPVLGRFEVILGLDGDLRAMANKRYIHIKSSDGLLIRTPEGMSDLHISSVLFDLKTLAVHIQSEPEVGPLETKIISEVLRSTLLAQAPQLAESHQGALAGALEVLPTDPKGRHIAYEHKALGVSLLSVLVDPSASATVTFNGQGLTIGIYPGLLVDTPGPDFTISSLRYHFASASFDIDQQGATTVLGVIGDMLKQPLLDGVELAGAHFFKDKLPAPMRVAGYDPTLDPSFNDNLDALYANFTGVHLLGAPAKAHRGGPEGSTGRDRRPAADGASAPAHEAASAAETDTEASAGPPRQVLYAVDSAAAGRVEICLEPGDAVTFYKDDKAVGLDAGRGIFLRIAGQPWLEDVRLSEIRYDLETGRLDFEGTDEMGEFVRSVLEDIVNAYVIPKLPGVARRGLGLEGQGDAAHQVIYSADLEGAGKVEVLLDKGDRLSVSKSEDVVEMSAGAGLILKAPALPALAQLRIQHIHYVLGTDALRIDADNDIGPMGEKIIAQLLRRYVMPQLPGGAGAKAAKTPAIDPALLASHGEIVYATKVGGLGRLEARLAGGDTLGVRSDGRRATVFAASGVLLVAPDAGVHLRVDSVTLDLDSGAVEVAASEALGGFERSVLSDIARKFAKPVIDAHYKRPTQDDDPAHRVLYRSGSGANKVEVCIDKGDAVQVTKDDAAITLSAGHGILLRAAKGGILPPMTRIQRVRVDLKDGSVVVDSRPDVGPLAELVGTQILRELILPHLPPELAAIGLHAPKDAGAQAAQAALPPPDGLVLRRGEFKGVGAFDISISGASAMKVDATAGSLTISSSGGLLVRVPGIKVSTRVTRVELDLAGGSVQIQSSTPLGAFETKLVENLFQRYGQPMVSEYITAPRAGGEGGDFDVLYSTSVDKLGTVSVCVPKGAGVSLEKGAETISLVAPQGLFLTGVDWLPEFKLHRVDYALGTGKFSIDVSGVAQGHYVEGEDVGALTEGVISNIVKALIGPHLPPAAQAIGIVGAEKEGGAQAPPRGASLLHQADAGSLGKVGIYLDQGDSLSISASETEGVVRSAKGLIVDAPDIHTRERLHSVRYHFETGEVQVEGLGALENALLQAALVEFVTPLLPKKLQGDAPVAAALGGLPKDREGRRQLSDSGSVEVSLSPGTRFDVTIAGGGLSFETRPGLYIDGPLFANFELNTLRYRFDEGHFRLGLEGSNLLARGFDGLARRKAEQQLDELLLPLLPEKVRRADYDLMRDPELPQTLAEIGQNFTARKRGE